jgi:nitrite reductase/ring-hydroxylating ferredoxin subunit
MTTQPELDRRTVLRGGAVAGIVVVAGPTLAACSSPSTGSGQPAQTTVKTGDVPVGGGVIKDATGVVVVQPTAGEFKAYSAICPHQGCDVDRVTDGQILCPCHGSVFRVSDGSVVSGPATQGLTLLPSTVTGGSVVVTP